MHACGHDCHVAILMGVAELLAGMKQQLAGRIKFIFQPAEEGPPPGEEGGAALMIKQGVLENPKPEVIFGLHVFAGVEAGMIAYRPGPRDGQFRPHQGDRERPPDPRGAALARGRPDRDFLADRARAADHRQPPGGCYAGTGGGQHRRDQGRRARQHHSRQRRNARHRAHLQRGYAQGHPCPHPQLPWK